MQDISVVLHTAVQRMRSRKPGAKRSIWATIVPVASPVKMVNGKAYVSAYSSARLDKLLDYYIATPKGTWADIFHVTGWY
ncbi:hypothetical protein [Streptomyces longwoodensis]|uniref:hypothetical protein n=1 Tax=Streptomyces longwoodensis TaxID=68231 RepID=UPI00131E19F6|nr:hypothetical protein [Streptomyces longwoodensis]